MTPAEIKQVLTEEKILLTKALGQNFLHDANQLRRIIAAAELSPTDQVLEIGPGLGALTHLLVTQVPNLLAIEKDHRLYVYLRRHLPDGPGFTLLHADALQYLQQQQLDLGNWKVVSNLPYSVASAILVELAKRDTAPQRLSVTLQFEVAERLIASARQDGYGVLSLLVQARYEPVTLFKIPPACFFPVPDVDSACIVLQRRAQPVIPREQARAFEKIVKRGFSQRRKMLVKLLKADWPLSIIQKAFSELGLSPQIRGEAVTLPQFAALTAALSSPV